MVVSELVSNSVRHAGLSGEDSIELWARVCRDSIRVTVRDNGKGIDPAVAARDLQQPTSAAGRGLYMVQRLTRRMLIDGDQGRVTIEMPLFPLR